jgi:hypothetical protein
MKSLSPTLARLVLWAFVACAELRVMEPRHSLLACGVRGARWRVLSALGRERAPAPHCRRASAAAAAAASARAASRGNSGCIFAHLLSLFTLQEAVAIQPVRSSFYRRWWQFSPFALHSTGGGGNSARSLFTLQEAAAFEPFSLSIFTDDFSSEKFLPPVAPFALRGWVCC